MKIYSRQGDDGTTGLCSGERVSKAHLRVEACGSVDELNAALGLARAANPHPTVAPCLERVQDRLFALGAELAAPPGPGKFSARITPNDIAWLEEKIDGMSGELPELRNFIHPGGTPAAAQIHAARAICRRAERVACALARQEIVGREALAYLNRLSDFLFTLARYENLRSGAKESLWISENQAK